MIESRKKLNKIIIILGPTASGKSSTAIKLAKKFNGEIISADSRQIYKGMDVGTGKIIKDLPAKIKFSSLRATSYKLQTNFISEGITHYMIDIVSPRTDFSVAKFKKKAEGHITDILKRGKVPIICGGTGFWIKAIVDDVIYPEVKPDWELRKKLEKKSPTQLFSMLKKLDPVRAENIDAKNPVRLIRAIEICQALGKVPKNKIKKDNKYDFLQIGILRNKEELHQRIKLNVEKRLKEGMIKEVKQLKKSGLSWKKIESFGLSFKLIPQFLRGEIKTIEELKEKIYLAEKNYAKRQMTWFKRDSRIKWLEDYKDIEKEVSLFLN